jgi:tRNA pseudouridine38-40 synthase
MKKSTLRRIDAVEICRNGEELHFLFTGNGFLYNMVRIMVGTLMEVGRGERSVESLSSLFGAKREDAGYLVPASGLCLMEVVY